MKFAQSPGSEYLFEYPFVLSAELHKIAKYFNCGIKIWVKLISSINVFIISMFDLF